MTKLKRVVESAVNRTGLPAVLIGQSRGGIFARALVVRRPELVQNVVSLGAPVHDQFGVHAYVLPVLAFVGYLGTLGSPGLFTASCAFGPCCGPARADTAAVVPQSTEFMSAFSKRDEIVCWPACLEPAETQVEVTSTQHGIGVNVNVWDAVAAFLSSGQDLRER